MRFALQPRALVTLLSVLLVGCYSYVPLETPTPGLDVRARLKADAAVKRSEGIDDPIVRYDGTIVDVAPEAVSLDVVIARSSSGLQDVVMRDTVTLQTAEIQSLTMRRFSPARTALFTIGTAVAAFGVIKGIERLVGSTDEIDNGPPTAVVVPLFTLMAGPISAHGSRITIRYAVQRR